MTNFDVIHETILDKIKSYAQEALGGREAEALKDLEQFINDTQADLKKWVDLLAQGELTEEDLSVLVNAKSALANTYSLRQANISLVEIEKFKKYLINTLIDTILGASIGDSSNTGPRKR